MIQHLGYNFYSERFGIFDQHGALIRPLHCGDCFSIKIGLKFMPTRIEHSDPYGWVLLIGNSWRSAHEYEGFLVT